MYNYLIKKNAFSLIEIMFVISIITFLSTSGVIYFNNFIDSKKIDSDLALINYSIENLDNTIKEKQNLDYEISFINNSNYFIYKTNQTIKNTETNIIIDNLTKDYTINTNFSTQGFWNLKIFSNKKIIFERLLDQRETLTGSIGLYQNYEFISRHQSGEDIFGINYFNDDSEDNIIETHFIEANTKQDKSGDTTGNFLLKNINGIHTFYSGTTLWKTKEVYLFFEKGGLEKSIKIIK